MQHLEFTGDGLATPRRWLVVFTMTCAVCASSMTVSIVNVALPSISQALNISAQHSVALVSTFQIAMVAALIPLAALGEIIGYRRVYLWGLALFGLTSFMVAESTGFGSAITWRFVQGIGAAGVLSVNTAILRFVYPKHLFGYGLGLNALVAGSSMAAGPPVAAAVLSLADWPWLFLINVPICGLALAVGFVAVPHTPRAAHRLAASSLILHVLSFGLLLAGLTFFTVHRAPVTGTVFTVAGAAFLVIYIRQEGHRAVPLLPFDLLRLPAFRRAVAASMCAFSAQILMLTTVPFWLERVAGYEASDLGWLLSPWPACTMLAAFGSGALSDRMPGVRFGVVGMGLFALGLASLATLSPHSSEAGIIARMMLCGFGFGLFQTPNNRTMLGAAPTSRTGSASGSLGTARMVGQALGSVVAAAALALGPSAALPLGAVLATLLALSAARVSAIR